MKQKICKSEIRANRLLADHVLLKPIRLTKHAHGYLARRGFTIEEVEKTIRESPWRAAELARMECALEFPFGSEWNGRYYERKLVRPIFVEETDEIVVVTVYVFYY